MLVLGAWCLVPSAMAQIDYENYTFITLAGQAAGWFDGAGSAARFNVPFGVAADAGGNLYVADTGNHTIRKVTSTGVATTLAGMAATTGSADGSGSNARFNGPQSVAVDGAGNVYVADCTNCAIRKITAAGVVTTLAGTPGVSGTNDAASGAAASFNFPYGVAVDTNGNVYVADTLNHTIRQISPSGAVTTLAGLAGNVGSSDGTNSGARFSYPCGVAVDGSGNVYVADTGNHTIRLVSPTGVVTTLAGSPGNPGLTNGTGSAAQFNSPLGVAVDSNGNVYVADTGNNTIRLASPAGVVTTLAGSPGNSGSTNGTGGGALFNSPVGVAVDGNGNVYVADSYNSTLRKVTTPDGVVTTLAGAAAGGGSADGAGSAAQFNYPCGVAVDTAGTVYVSDLANHTIRQITPAGVVTTLAGTPSSGPGTNDGTGTAASFGEPAGLAVDTNGNVYVADYANHTIRKIAPGGIVTTLAGDPGVGGSTNGTGSAAKFLNPLGVAVDAQGNVYVADMWNDLIRKITPNGTVSTLAGVAGTSGTNDGPAATALFSYPQGVAVDASGNVFVADTSNSTIRKITPGGVVSTLAGTAKSKGASDGLGAAAQFSDPFSIAVDSQGYLYVADSGNNTIRKISPDGTVKTLAGAVGVAGGTDGSGPEALFTFPEGVAVDASGNLYATSTGTGTIRKGNPALPDTPVVDPAFGAPGTIRHFDVTNLTATSWSWSIVRYPSTSSAQLSSTTARNPTLTPDVPDLFIVRFQGSDSLGRATIGSIAVSTNVTLPALNITQPQPNQQVTNFTFTVTGTASGASGVAAVWCQLDGGPWIQAVGTLDWTAVISLTNQGQNTLSAYAVDPNGEFSATNSVLFLYAPAPPALSITQPQPNQQVTTPAFTIAGTASAGLGVAAVWYQLDGGSWTQAVGTLDWTAVISLTNQPTNTLSAYAVDVNGTFSATNTVRFTAGTLQVSGGGTISPTSKGLFLIAGKFYTLTAKPASGYIFLYWTDSLGDILTTSPRISFTMPAGLGLRANFIPNPFIPLAGTYAGLFADTNKFSPASAGSFSTTLTSLGSFTAQLQLAGGAYRFSGPLSPYGAYSNLVAGPGGNPLAVQLQLDLGGSQSLTGSVAGATWRAGLAASRAANSQTNLPQAGKKYTLMIPGAADASTEPGGYGFGTLSVSTSGTVAFSGLLGDGTKVTASSVVAGSGQWPLYLSPSAYAGKGLVWGWLGFATNSAGQTVGSLTWLKQAGLPGKLYPKGFAFSGGVQVTESLYSYTSGARALNWTNGVIELDGGNLSSNLTNAVTLGANNKLSGANKLSLTLTTASGLFQGTVPAPGSKSGIAVSGVLLQGDNAGYGLFLGATNSGSVYLGE